MFYNFIYYQLLIILLLVFLYFYYLYINNKKKNKDLEMAEIKSAKDINKQLIKKIKILLKKIEELSKTEFYEKLNKIFREYFDII
jgi:cbb3-type cytochrome oxidase subunit 3